MGDGSREGESEGAISPTIFTSHLGVLPSPTGETQAVVMGSENDDTRPMALTVFSWVKFLAGKAQIQGIGVFSGCPLSTPLVKVLIKNHKRAGL